MLAISTPTPVLPGGTEGWEEDDQESQRPALGQIYPALPGERLSVPVYRLTTMPLRVGHLKRVKGSAFPWHVRYAGGITDEARLITIEIKSDEWGTMIRRLKRPREEMAKVSLWERYEEAVDLATFWREGRLRDGLYLLAPVGKPGPVEPYYVEKIAQGIQLFRDAMRGYQPRALTVERMGTLDVVARYVNYIETQAEVIERLLEPK